jgi:hypothetical protein
VRSCRDVQEVEEGTERWRGSSNVRTAEGSVVDADDRAVGDARVTENLTWSTLLERRTATEFVDGERAQLAAVVEDVIEQGACVWRKVGRSTGLLRARAGLLREDE